MAMGVDLVADRQHPRHRPLVRLVPTDRRCPAMSDRNLLFDGLGLPALFAADLHAFQLHGLLCPWQVSNMPCEPSALIVLAFQAIRPALEPCGQFARGDTPEAFRLVSERAILRVEV